MIRKNISLALILVSFFGFSQSLKKGVDLFDQGKLKQAKTFFTAIDDENAERNYYLGRIAFDEDEWDDAVDFFEDAIDEEESSTYYTWLGNSLGVMAQNANIIRQGMLAPQIKDAYEKAVSLNPREMDAQWGLVQYYTQAPSFMGGSYEKAEETAKAIKKIDPLRGSDALAIVYNGLEKYDLAEKEYITASKLDSKRLLNLGMFYQRRSDYEKAFETFEKAIATDSTDFGSLYQIGKTSALSGLKLDRGIVCLDDYLKEEPQNGNPSHAGALMRLGMIYEKKGSKSEAIASYKKSLKLEPNMEQAEDGLARLK